MSSVGERLLTALMSVSENTTFAVVCASDMNFFTIPLRLAIKVLSRFKIIKCLLTNCLKFDTDCYSNGIVCIHLYYSYNFENSLISLITVNVTTVLA